MAKSFGKKLPKKSAQKIARIIKEIQSGAHVAEDIRDMRATRSLNTYSACHAASDGACCSVMLKLIIRI